MKRRHLSLLTILIISLTLGGCRTTTSKSSSDITVQVPPITTSSSNGQSNSSSPSSSSENIPPRVTYGKYVCKEGIEEDSSFLQGSPWLNTSIDGAMDIIEKPSLKDDFFANVNYEYLTEHTLTGDKKVGGGNVYDSSELADQRLHDLFDPSGNNFLDDLAENICDGSVNYAKNRILTIFNSSGDELREMVDAGFFFEGPNRIFKICRAPQDTCPTLDVVFTQEYPSLLFAIYLDLFSEQDSSYSQYVEALLNCYDIHIPHESIRSLCFAEAFQLSFEADWTPFKTDVLNVNHNFPNIRLSNVLVNLGFSYRDEFKISPGMIAFIEGVYRNIYNDDETLRSLMIDMATLDSMLLLGKEKFYAFKKDVSTLSTSLIPWGFSDGISDVDYAIKVIEHLFPELLNVEYFRRYITNSAQGKLMELVKDILTAYNELFDDSSWLSAQTKNKVKEKLNNMRYTVFSEVGVSGLPASFDTNHLTENLVDTMEYYEKWYDEGILRKYFNTGSLTTSFHIYTANAAYANADNTFMICHGIFSSFIDNEDLSKEELYANAGFIIGHEISHAFDNYGSTIWNGQEVDWWEPNDKALFNDKVSKLINYINTNISTLSDATINGENLAGEVIADMGSMRVLLRLIKKQNNFDLDAFFKYFAKLWSAEYTNQEAHRRIVEDTHAASFIRVNLTLVQFEEFKNLYNISQGDNMYIPNEDVIAIW